LHLFQMTAYGKDVCLCPNEPKNLVGIY
jgi:hypothetical protein